MTEIIIITVLVSAGIYLFRLARRAWCRVRGQEEPPGSDRPLPIVRLATYLRDLVCRIRGRKGSRRAKGGPGEETLETE
jgi:hypothetical protein